MKKLIVLTAALAMTAGFALNASADGSAHKDIVILYTNDVHCGIDDHIGYDGLALYKREMQAEHENVLLVDAGDAIQGASIGSMSEGADIVPLMNKVGYDAAVPGNHEFDYGLKVFLKRAEELECGYICCNITDKTTGSPLFDPYKLIDCGDTKIAFVGVDTPETFFKSTPTFFQNDQGEYIYSFSEQGTMLYDIVQESVDKARGDGADHVILLAHLGETDVTEGWSAQEVVANTNGIDAVIDAHSHDITPSLTVQNKDGADVTITQTGTKLANIGKMTITDNGITTELISEVPAPDENIPADSYTVIANRDGTDRYVDSEINIAMEELKAKYEAQNRKIGETPFALYDSEPETGVRRIRNGETNMGDLCADAVRAYYDTDVAILNGGGIRTTLRAGDIHYLDLMAVYPYGNALCAARVTGQQILDYLERGVSGYPDETPGFPNVSGIEFTIDKSVESSVTQNEFGEFTGVTGEYRVKNVLINGEPLDKERTYTLASINYLLKTGGDGYIFSGKCDLYIDEGVLDIDVLASFIENDLGGIIPEEYRNPYGNGRIKEIGYDEPIPDTEPSPEPEILPQPKPEQEEVIQIPEHRTAEFYVQTTSAPGVKKSKDAANTYNPTFSDNTAYSKTETSSGSVSSAVTATETSASSDGGNPETGAAVSSLTLLSLVLVFIAGKK